MVDDGVLAYDHHELVIGRDADVLHVDHVRVLVDLGELDRLVVPVRAEGRVDAARQHRRNEVAADVDLLDRVRGNAGMRQDRLQVCVLVRDPGIADALAAQLGAVLMCLEPIETIEVSGSWTIAATDTSGNPWLRASRTSGS